MVVLSAPKLHGFDSRDWLDRPNQNGACKSSRLRHHVKAVFSVNRINVGFSGIAKHGPISRRASAKNHGRQNRQRTDKLLFLPRFRLTFGGQLWIQLICPITLELPFWDTGNKTIGLEFWPALNSSK